MQTVLVANRGVIARRIMRTCQWMGLTTIGIYTPTDTVAAFYPQADLLLEVPDLPAQSGYLNQAYLIALAREHQASIHPGYGFLSENATFREACDQAGVPFIGPSATVLHTAGNKILCTQQLQHHGLPVIPSLAYSPATQLPLEAFEELGYPLMIKPACGGGGIGMKQVQNRQELEAELENTARLAQQYFGDPSLLIEKYLPGAKHIEVQLLADQQGQCLHLFERECSWQRRQQKVLEEAPSPSLNAGQREALYALALQIAQMIQLDNIATIEFLLHEGQFYFLEINPRLQVEHALTEEITGIDLVEWQIRLAQGESIAAAQGFQQIVGHSMEARIYAEDPYTSLPSPGTITYLSLPEGQGIRVESGCWNGLTVSEAFDSLLMKIIAHGPNREQARSKLQMALQALDINGTLRVNSLALLTALRSEEFKQGTYDTTSFERLTIQGEPWQQDLAGILADWVRERPLAQGQRPSFATTHFHQPQSPHWQPTFRQSE